MAAEEDGGIFGGGEIIDDHGADGRSWVGEEEVIDFGEIIFGAIDEFFGAPIGEIAELVHVEGTGGLDFEGDFEELSEGGIEAWEGHGFGGGSGGVEFFGARLDAGKEFAVDVGDVFDGLRFGVFEGGDDEGIDGRGGGAIGASFGDFSGGFWWGWSGEFGDDLFGFGGELRGIEIEEEAERGDYGVIGADIFTDFVDEIGVEAALFDELVASGHLVIGGLIFPSGAGEEIASGIEAKLGGFFGDGLVVGVAIFLFEGGEFFLEVGELVEGGHGDDGFFWGFDAGGEDAVEGVIIFGGDGVEFVIVAACAGDRHGEEAFADGIDAIVDDIVGISEAFADGEEAEGGEARVVWGDVGEFIGGELFDDELVVGFVVVEGFDDIVAVGPSVGVTVIHFAVISFTANGIGVASGIEPVAAPAFAVGWGSEEAIDDAGEGLWGDIGDEVADFLWGRGEAGEVVSGAAEEGFAGGVWGWEELLGFEFGEDESIDAGEAPRLIFDWGLGGFGDWLIGPVAAGFIGEAREFEFGIGARIWGAHFDPGGEGFDLGIGEATAFFGGGHLEVFVLVIDRLDEGAGSGVAWFDGGTDFSAFEEAFAGI